MEHGIESPGTPFMCMGFVFGDRDIVYISDTNKIPDDCYAFIANPKLLVIDALGGLVTL